VTGFGTGGLVIRPYGVTFETRDFQPAAAPRGEFVPLRCSWSGRGGPDRATIAVTGDARSHAGLSGWLGRAVVIHDPQGSPYWWGYLHGISLRDGAFAWRLNLDALANRLAVLHTLPDGVTTNLTGWAEDPGSQSIHGVRERILTLEGVSAERALAWRDAELAARAYPRWTADLAKLDDPACLLDCRGWYDTLAWRYYACAAGDPLETTAQMANIVSGCGQFLAGTRVGSPSGVFTDPWREGLTTARLELELLAGLGDANGRAYRLRIGSDRKVVIDQVPLPGECDWSLGEDGAYRDEHGVRLPPWASPVGRWVRPVGSASLPAQPPGGGAGAGYVGEWEFNFPV